MIRLVMLRLLLLAIALAACSAHAKAPAAPARPTARPLYDRLGGVDAIDDVVKDLLGRVTKDSRIGARFTAKDLAKLERLMTDQLCELTGGPCKYTGRTMKDAHVGMGITEAELAAFLEDLRASLDALHVPKAEQDELMRKLQTMHDDIVEKQS